MAASVSVAALDYCCKSTTINSKQQANMRETYCGVIAGGTGTAGGDIGGSVIDISEPVNVPVPVMCCIERHALMSACRSLIDFFSAT